MCLIITVLLHITFKLLDEVLVGKVDFICDQISHMQHPVHAHLVIVHFFTYKAMYYYLDAK